MLVKVDLRIFLVDFVVLNFKADTKTPFILGRMFFEKGTAMIDVEVGHFL